jgi:hypothetical protein
VIVSLSGNVDEAGMHELQMMVQELAFMCFAYSLLAQIPDMSNLYVANPSIDLNLICTFLLA